MIVKGSVVKHIGNKKAQEIARTKNIYWRECSHEYSTFIIVENITYAFNGEEVIRGRVTISTNNTCVHFIIYFYLFEVVEDV